MLGFEDCAGIIVWREEDKIWGKNGVLGWLMSIVNMVGLNLYDISKANCWACLPEPNHPMGWALMQNKKRKRKKVRRVPFLCCLFTSTMQPTTSCLCHDFSTLMNGIPKT